MEVRIMKNRIKTKVLIFAGITVLKVILLTGAPLSYATTAESSPDVITEELKDAAPNRGSEAKKWTPWNWFKKEESNAGVDIPIQRENKNEQQDRFAAPLRDFHREIDRLFDRTFRDFGFSSFGFDRPLSLTANRMLRPVTDLSASDKEYTVTVEIPGAEKDDIKIEVSNNIITVRGEKKQKKEETNKEHYRQERFYGSFQRVLSLPKDADQNNIKAVFRQGVLTVTMPRKAIPKPDVKEIPIEFD